MKKNLVFLLIAFSLASQAQSPGKNEVKINFSALAFKSICLQYERQVTSRATVALGYAAIPFSSMPYKSYIKKQVFVPEADIANFRLSSSIFTPEVRCYFGKRGAFHGFYVAPYGRFSTFKITGPLLFDNDMNVKQRADFSGKVHANTAGLMLGLAWQISPKFYADWWIIGASYGREKGNFTALVQLTPANQASLRKTLNSLSLSGINLSSQVNDTGAFVQTSGNLTGFRGFGINVGFRF